jgi:hypothetical protein
MSRVSVFGTLALIIACNSSSRTESECCRAETVVARINGEPIEFAELRGEMAEERAGVVQQYHSSPKVTTGMMELLRKRALETTLTRKLTQVLMKQYGIFNDISYSSFLVRWHSDNKARTDAVAAGRPVHGPLKLNERDYFEYEFSNALRELRAAKSEVFERPYDAAILD